MVDLLFVHCRYSERVSVAAIEDLNKEILKNVARHLRPLNDLAVTVSAPPPLATPMTFAPAPLLPSGPSLAVPAAAKVNK